ncbi:conserved hypothetical protein [Ammonifex degensii KC4]|uniref:DUF1634 domain-containing protein n=1 Tax=Ammonifex degensii (strain DSM 10501 / KC4) TaxID=429009 RepID=C9RAS1_AMMDK|nr:hypothetical protein [Ammonifex degensii]ACX51348.1 conserved hypothetical protein [Ammonifex degensii KC4]
MSDKGKAVEIPREQQVYATVLYWGMLIGMGLLIVTFILYVFGVLKPFIPVTELPKLWGMKVKKFVEVARVPTGWNWVYYLGKGDFLNYIGIAILAGLQVLGFIILFPFYVAKRDVPFTIIVLAEIVVLLLAISGVIHLAE